MNDIVCVECKYVGKPKIRRRGSNKWEMMGWTLFFPLGVPYTIWRMLVRIPTCKYCKGTMLLDVDSIAGQRLVMIAAGERVYPVAPQLSNVSTPAEDTYGENTSGGGKMALPLTPVLSMQTTPEPTQNPPHDPVKEPGPAPKPIDEPKPPAPAEQAGERGHRLDPNVW